MVDIENVRDGDTYIEMDLGLGVLEEVPADQSSESNDSDSSNTEVLHKLLNKTELKRPGIIEMDQATEEEGTLLSCDHSLRHYRAQSSSDISVELDIVLSLMSRILVILRKNRSCTTVQTITKLNVLREDMYKLMSRRDRLLVNGEENQPIKHESLYPNELDRLLESVSREG